MNIYAFWNATDSTGKLFIAPTNPLPLDEVDLMQDDLIPLVIARTDGTQQLDISAYQVEIAVQGAGAGQPAGEPTGQESDEVLAAYLKIPAGTNWDAPNLQYDGVSLDCRGAGFQTLIGSAADHNTVLAVKFTKNDGSEIVQMILPANVKAAVIKANANPSVPSPGGLTINGVVPAGQAQADIPIQGTLPANPKAVAWQLSAGPGINYCTVNALDGTVTVNLLGPAPGPNGTQVKIFIGGQ
jgi:hypothetical protein